VCPRIGPLADGKSPDEMAEFEAEFIGDEDLVDSDEADAAATAEVVPFARRLADDELSDLRIDVLHGRMTGESKDDVMRRFTDPGAADGIDVLVSTTVIEVGVDVPAATMMVVMDADRFGISQLHQLRGRVGRGGLPGLCLLVTQAVAGAPARERLDAVASTTDGFVLAALDLEIRREGDVLGSSQSGRRSSLRLLEVSRHEEVIVDARAVATALIAADPHLVEHPDLADAVARLVEDEHSEFLEKG